MVGVLNRRQKDNKQTLGHFTLYDGVYKIFECYTLELPDLNNKPRISRIYSGEFNVVKRWSKKYGTHFHVTNVDGRSWILFHNGNYHYQIKGCILVGESITDINHDGYRDVTSSVNTMRKFTKLTKGFKLIINDEV